MWEAWDAVAARERSQGKNADQESVIVAISRRNNDDDNNNDNDNSNNLFKVDCSKILKQNERTQAMLKCKTKQTLRTLIKGKPAD